MIKKIIIGLLTIVSFGILTNYETGYASTGSSFSVQPILPDNQEGHAGYFDLIINSGDTQEISVRVFNESDEKITVIPELNRATTSNVGNIQYLVTDEALDETTNELAVNIETIVSSELSSITLEPQSSQIVSWQINMPEEAFTGILLGGLRFTLEEPEESQSGIENRFAYTVGLVLQNSDNQPPVALHLGEIKPGQLNYRNHILANMQNNQPRIIDEMSITAEVFQEGNQQPIYTASNQGLRMAPNSSFDYAISTNETAFQPGKYILKMTALADGEEFAWEESFEIASDESNQLNEKAILIQTTGVNIWMWVSIVAVGVCGVLGLLYVKKQNKS